ncbi:MAG: hypothetical protein LBQ57_13490, partial [Spirochaetales bacterium]|nr:hypothetical protein [Spirochaetales bacterium]
FAKQKTGLSASIFWLRQKDLRCNPWRGPGASGDFARKKLVHPQGNSTYFFRACSKSPYNSEFGRICGVKRRKPGQEIARRALAK